MRILFGPEEDVLHIDPQEPNGYEWWYFDAVSDDGRYVLVTIFFLGTPMSPYYKAVADGKNPLPKDWCGVFFTLHERTPKGYVERAYTYNLYTDDPGDFNFFRVRDIRLGDSAMSGSYSHNGRRFTHGWDIKLNERNLWLGSTRAELRFDAAFVLKDIPAIGDEQSHNWVCVAPQCRVQGTITLSGGASIPFSGTGYHDHNYGMLPWTDMSTWVWGRTHFADAPDTQGMVHYSWRNGTDAGGVFCALWDKVGNLRLYEPPVTAGKTTAPVVPVLDFLEANGVSDLETVRRFPLQSAPFYKRYVARVEATLPPERATAGIEIGESFEPARLCGPILSKALWTRIRRRS